MLADTEADLAEHGRIGYGRYGKLTPIGLALVLLLTIGAIGIASALRDGDDPGSGAQFAPDIELTLLDGTVWRLSDHRGKVVVVNFWASWCEPCKDEMPALQEVASGAGSDVVVVGVGAKLDRDDEVATFVRDAAITYPIGRDTAGDDRGRGPAQTAYGVFAFPTTIFIAPDGTIAATVIDALTRDEIEAYIATART